MNKVYSFEEIGIKKGDKFKVLRCDLPFYSGQAIINESDILTFDYATNAHWDEVDSFFFINSSGQSIRFDFSNETQLQSILNALTKDYLAVVSK